MRELPEYVDGLPNLCGSEPRVEAAVAAGRHRPVFLDETSVDIAGIDSAFAVALHMHQPLIPAGGPELRTAAIVSNLQWMLEHLDLGDNHNAPVFQWCYTRTGKLISQLLAEGTQPRIMLEYSGTLLHGLRHAGLDDVVDALPTVTGPLAQRRQRPRRRTTPNATTTTTTTISTHNHVDMAASLVDAGAVRGDATAAHPSKQLGHGQATSLARIVGRAARWLAGTPAPPRPARRSGPARQCGPITTALTEPDDLRRRR